MRVDQKERSKNRHESFEALLERMRPEVVRYVEKRLDSAHADEVIADVFIAAHAAQERGVTIAPGWIMRVARNKVVDRWRRNAHRVAIQNRLIFDRSGHLSNPTYSHDRSAASTAVAETLALLPPRYRGLLRQHYLEGIPIAQMATTAGASYTATESALARARRAFKKHHDVGT